MFVNKLTKNAVLALGLMLAFGGCTKTPPEEAMVKKMSEDSVKLTDDAIKNLKLEKVIKGEFPDKLSLMGRISVPEDRVAVVPARISGRTDAVYVASGEVVTAGQPLMSIFSADFSIAKEEYLQAYRQVQASPADEEAKKLLSLTKRKLSALGVGNADVEKWNTSATGIPDTPHGENLTVRAPRSGALLGKNAMIGSIVNVGDSLFQIGDLSKVWFAGDIYPEDLKKIHKDQRVIIDPGSGSAPLEGKVSFISPAVDPNSRTIKIRALMANPGEQLRADMYVQGNVILSTHTALIAPKSALVRIGDDIFCFKRISGSNVFKKVAVTFSSEGTDTISVTKGLDEGDEVVSEGGLLLEGALGGAGT